MFYHFNLFVLLLHDFDPLSSMYIYMSSLGQDIEFFFVNGEGYRVLLGIRRRIKIFST